MVCRLGKTEKLKNYKLLFSKKFLMHYTYTTKLKCIYRLYIINSILELK